MDPKIIGRPTSPLQMDSYSPYLKTFNQVEFSELSKLYQEGKLGEEVFLAAALQKKGSRVAMGLIEASTQNLRDELDTFKLAAATFPQTTHAQWASLTCMEKYAVALKIAHQPLLKARGLDKGTVRNGHAFMVYKVDPNSHNSKFYEGLIVDDEGGYRVIRRWGALTDSGETGRVDGGKFDQDPRFVFEDAYSASKELNKHLRNRLNHGYVSAFDNKHRTPDGKALPMGQYPVGLTREVGFGWGTQSVTFCIPGLRQLEVALQEAREEIADTGRSEAVKEHLLEAQNLIRNVAHADSTMGQKLMRAMGKPFRRVNESPRFLPDADGRKLSLELQTIIRYIVKQLSLCREVG